MERRTTSTPILVASSGLIRREGTWTEYQALILDADGIVWRCQHTHDDDNARECAKAELRRWADDPPKSRAEASKRP